MMKIQKALIAAGHHDLARRLEVAADPRGIVRYLDEILYAVAQIKEKVQREHGSAEKLSPLIRRVDHAIDDLYEGIKDEELHR